MSGTKTMYTCHQEEETLIDFGYAIWPPLVYLLPIFFSQLFGLPIYQIVSDKGFDLSPDL